MRLPVIRLQSPLRSRFQAPGRSSIHRARGLPRFHPDVRTFSHMENLSNFDVLSWGRRVHTYQYPVLPTEQSIRLLKLYPGIDSKDGKLHCTLEPFVFRDVPNYLALSYTWDHPEDVPSELDRKTTESCHIYIDAKPLSVTQNLYNALLQLQTLSDKELLYWIDAVSINQDDVAEKSAQVNQMCDIYERAARVIVWLGKDVRGEADSLGHVIPYMSNAWKRYCNENGVDHVPKLDDQFHLSDPDYISKLGLPVWSDDTWVSLGLFFHNRYFRRIWCAQELVLAQKPDDVLVLLGHAVFDWSDIIYTSQLLSMTSLSRALGALLGYRAFDGLLPVLPPEGQVGDDPSSLFSLSLLLDPEIEKRWDYQRDIALNVTGQTVETRNASGTLLLLFSRVPNREATDVRDKVYALLGMVNKWTRDRGVAPCPIIADYSKAANVVFEEAARSIMEGTSSLNFLSFLRSSSLNTVPDVASWAAGLSSLGWPPLINRAAYDASRILSDGSLAFQFVGDSLHVHAVQVARVAEISAEGQDISRGGDLLDCLRLTMNTPLIGRNNQPRAEVLWRTLAGDFSNNKPIPALAPSASKREFNTWLRFILVGRQVLDFSSKQPAPTALNDELLSLLDQLAATDSLGLIPSGEEVRTLFLQCTDGANSTRAAERRLHQALERPGESFDHDVMHMLPHRRVFRSETGDLGLGPDSMEVGDEVWVLSGARVPFVLRRAEAKIEADGKGKGKEGEDEAYVLLGEAYVHGMMRGEGLGEGPLHWKALKIV